MDEFINKTQLLKKTKNFMVDYNDTWQAHEIMAWINAMPSITREELLAEREEMADLLQDAVNELCGACGRYRSEHLGYCDGCKWREYRCG